MAKWIAKEVAVVGVREHLLRKFRWLEQRFERGLPKTGPGPLGMGRHYGAIADRLEAGDTITVSWWQIRDFIQVGAQGHFDVHQDGSISAAEIRRFNMSEPDSVAHPSKGQLENRSHLSKGVTSHGR